MATPERKSLFTKPRGTGQGNRPETFAFTVVSYDLTGDVHAVNGIRLDNGKEVKVTLRHLDGPTGDHARAEIADFAAERASLLDPGTSPGGIMLAQEAFHNDDGAHAARWIQVLSHHPGEAEVFHTTITVSPVMTSQPAEKNAKPKQSSYMQLLHDGDFGSCSNQLKDLLKITPPFKVDNVAELDLAITDLLGDDLGVGVRVSNAEDFDGGYVKFDRKKFRELTTPEDRIAFAKAAAQEFITGLGDVAGEIDSGKYTCEVICYSNIWAGPKTAQAMAKRGNMQVRLNRFQEYVERTGTDSAGNAKEPLRYSVYRPAIVAIRQTKPDAENKTHPYFSHFEPLNTKPPIRGLADAITLASTEVLAPAIPIPENNQNAQAPASGTSGASAEKPEGAAPAAGDSSTVGTDLPAEGSGFSFASGSDDDLLFEAEQLRGDQSRDIGGDAAAAPAAAPAPAPRRYTGRRATA